MELFKNFRWLRKYNQLMQKLPTPSTISKGLDKKNHKISTLVINTVFTIYFIYPIYATWHFLAVGIGTIITLATFYLLYHIISTFRPVKKHYLALVAIKFSFLVVTIAGYIISIINIANYHSYSDVIKAPFIGIRQIISLEHPLGYYGSTLVIVIILFIVLFGITVITTISKTHQSCLLLILIAIILLVNQSHHNSQISPIIMLLYIVYQLLHIKQVKYQYHYCQLSLIKKWIYQLTMLGIPAIIIVSLVFTTTYFDQLVPDTISKTIRQTPELKTYNTLSPTQDFRNSFTNENYNQQLLQVDKLQSLNSLPIRLAVMNTYDGTTFSMDTNYHPLTGFTTKMKHNVNLNFITLFQANLSSQTKNANIKLFDYNYEFLPQIGQTSTLNYSTSSKFLQLNTYVNDLTENILCTSSNTRAKNICSKAEYQVTYNLEPTDNPESIERQVQVSFSNFLPKMSNFTHYMQQKIEQVNLVGNQLNIQERISTLHQVANQIIFYSYLSRSSSIESGTSTLWLPHPHYQFVGSTDGATVAQIDAEFAKLLSPPENCLTYDRLAPCALVISDDKLLAGMISAVASYLGLSSKLVVEGNPELQPDGTGILYAHNLRIDVQVFDEANRWQTISATPRTDNHLPQSSSGSTIQSYKLASSQPLFDTKNSFNIDNSKLTSQSPRNSVLNSVQITPAPARTVNWQLVMGLLSVCLVAGLIIGAISLRQKWLRNLQYPHNYIQLFKYMQYLARINGSKLTTFNGYTDFVALNFPDLLPLAKVLNYNSYFVRSSLTHSLDETAIAMVKELRHKHSILRQQSLWFKLFW